MTKNICEFCKTRKINTTVVNDSTFCTECFEEAGWENTHGDEGHNEILAKIAKAEAAGAVELRKLASGIIKNANKHKSESLRKLLIDALNALTEGCWICHPELNEAQKVTMKAKRRVHNPSTERKSRVGQVINVPLKAPGIIKAEVTKAKLGDDLLLNINTDKFTHEVRLDVNSSKLVLILVWDADGRYDYEKSAAVVDGKKRMVRNVAEALRLAKA